MAKVPFRISSGLKNIIGKELITDEFIAVFELVKNSFDANAKTVEITFENQDNPEVGKITVRDDGKGMNKDDLLNKWLFVAYSAKREGTENEDYRNRIRVNRYLAGAKGIGRFSCDRLGSELLLTTVKDEKNSKIETLRVNWEDFEKDSKQEFVKIDTVLETLGPSTKFGTVLEITGLRDVWDRDRLLKLKKSLAKLINPGQENDSSNFRIKLAATSELAADRKEENSLNKVNGLVTNDLFENLKIKTTSLKVEISENGERITSTLEDRGDRIYTLVEKNPFDLLHNVGSHLFQLNRSAKINFSKAMGLPSVEYGSIFLYKNGFRIYPFGEQYEDTLGINRRKQQGYNRFLGTRDLIGRIEINGANPELRETSSRDRGLEKTETYNQLITFVYDFVLRRLENYVVNVIKWGDPKLDELNGETLRPELLAKDVKLEILEIITGFIKSESVISIEYDKDFLRILDEKQGQNVDKIVRNITRIGSNSKNPAIVKEAEKIGKAVGKIRADARQDRVRADKAEETLKYVIGQNNFLKNEISDDTKNLESILHHIGLTTNFIKIDLTRLVKAINEKEDQASILKIVQRISAENQKITSFTKYFRKVNFDPHSNIIQKDVVGFINEYLENVYKLREDLRMNRELIDIEIVAPPRVLFEMKFNPIEVVMILDNLISNSSKKEIGAKKVWFEWSEPDKNSITLSVRDNGGGIKPEVLDHLFDFGFTTSRNGSGLGLFHVKELLQKMKARIDVLNPKRQSGAHFLITFTK